MAAAALLPGASSFVGSIFGWCKKLFSTQRTVDLLTVGFHSLRVFYYPAICKFCRKASQATLTTTQPHTMLTTKLIPNSISHSLVPFGKRRPAPSPGAAGGGAALCADAIAMAVLTASPTPPSARACNRFCLQTNSSARQRQNTCVKQPSNNSYQ